MLFLEEEKVIILIPFRWLSSLWLNLVISDVKWHPIAFKMGFTALQQAMLPSRQLREHTLLTEGNHMDSYPLWVWLTESWVLSVFFGIFSLQILIWLGNPLRWQRGSRTAAPLLMLCWHLDPSLALKLLLRTQPSGITEPGANSLNGYSRGPTWPFTMLMTPWGDLGRKEASAASRSHFPLVWGSLCHCWLPESRLFLPSQFQLNSPP